MSADRLISAVISVALVMFSAIVHECAHGWMALKLGDPTAKEQGRLTLNPLAHIDPVGSILIPVLMALIGGPMFAFAKPVPFNPRRLRNPRRDEALVALAGPVSNLLQAVAGTLVLYVVYQAFDAISAGLGYEVAYWLWRIFLSYVYVNLTLCFFNLIPIPPLDGSKLISPLVKSPDARRVYNYVQHYGMPVLILCLYILPQLGVDPVGWFLDVTAGNVFDLLLWWV